MKKNQKILCYFMFFLFTCIVINTFYRPYIYSNKIYDYGIADVGNNLFFIPAIYLMTILIYKKPIFGVLKDIYFHLIILTVIEILSNYINYFGTYDIKDILGLVVGSVIAYAIKLKLNLT